MRWTVPMYDARLMSSIITGSSLRNIPKLDKYEGPLPRGSLVVVGYTSNVYEGDDHEFHLNLNILWGGVVYVPTVDVFSTRSDEAGD